MNDHQKKTSQGILIDLLPLLRSNQFKFYFDTYILIKIATFNINYCLRNNFFSASPLPLKSNLVFSCSIIYNSLWPFNLANAENIFTLIQLQFIINNFSSIRIHSTYPRAKYPSRMQVLLDYSPDFYCRSLTWLARYESHLMEMGEERKIFAIFSHHKAMKILNIYLDIACRKIKSFERGNFPFLEWNLIFTRKSHYCSLSNVE